MIRDAALTPDAIRARLVPVFRKEPIAVAYLFGSVAAGKATKESDIDIAVLAESALSKDERHDLWIRLYDLIEKALGYPDQKTDISVLQDTSTLLQMNAINAKCVLFEHNRSERILYEFRVWQRYEDEAYRRAREEEYTLARILHRPARV